MQKGVTVCLAARKFSLSNSRKNLIKSTEISFVHFAADFGPGSGPHPLQYLISASAANVQQERQILGGRVSMGVGLMLLENSFVLFCWVVVLVLSFFKSKILKSVRKSPGKKQPIRHTLGMNPMKTY